jgi:hypothetical protein
MKAKKASEAISLDQIPNVGKSIANDLVAIGIKKPQQLVGKDPVALYHKLEKVMGQRHDPCVCDTLMAAVDFMEGGKSRPWWDFTAKRKKLLAKS